MNHLKNLKASRGGARPGAGRKPGGKNQATLHKEAAREVLRQRVLQDLEPMVRAQVANAIGISHFFLREPKSGQFVKIEDPKAIQTALNAGDEGKYYWIFTKDPSVQAFTDLMNRAIDKPKEQEQEIRLSGEVTLIDKLLAGRKRAAEAAKRG